MHTTIYIGADHAGFRLKEYLKGQLASSYEVIDCGANTFDKQDDYPEFAQKVSEQVVTHRARGILICDTGIGMSIAANRYEDVRAALVTDIFMAERSRLHNNANIICLGQELADDATNAEYVRIWLTTDFSGAERHIRRLDQIETGGMRE
jgi:ribose 5-phosphate isomerase B